MRFPTQIRHMENHVCIIFAFQHEQPFYTVFMDKDYCIGRRRRELCVGSTIVTSAPIGALK